MKDLYHNILVTQILVPATATVNKTSTSIDLQGHVGASVVFAVGASGDTLSGSVYWTLNLEHSDDNSSFSACTTADVYNSAASIVIDSASEDELAYVFGYKGTKRYVRGVATKTGTHTNGTPIGIVALRHAAQAPIA